MNESDLRRSTVRITVGTHATGTGFVVDRNLVLTCRHVIGDADLDTVRVGPGSAPVAHATLPPVEDGEPVFDLTLLHTDMPSVPEVVLDVRPPEPGDALFTFGFTDWYPEGDSALFTFEGLSFSRQQPIYRLKDAQARPGLSGAPLLNRRTGTVVGVVSRSRGKESDLGARAVPIESAMRLRPELARKVRATAVTVAKRDADQAHLARLIAIHERNVRLLETQVAAFGAMDVPMHKQNALEDERAELARLRSRLTGG